VKRISRQLEAGGKRGGKIRARTVWSETPSFKKKQIRRGAAEKKALGNGFLSVTRRKKRRGEEESLRLPAATHLFRHDELEKEG